MAANRALSGLVLAALLLSGCATERQSTFAELGPEANTKGFGDLYPPDEKEGVFTFGIGDSVGLLVQNNPDLSGTFPIRMDGKITLQVITDAVQHDGNTYANGQQFQVSEAQAKELLKTGKVIKAS